MILASFRRSAAGVASTSFVNGLLFWAILLSFRTLYHSMIIEDPWFLSGSVRLPQPGYLPAMLSGPKVFVPVRRIVVEDAYGTDGVAFWKEPAASSVTESALDLVAIDIAPPTFEIVGITRTAQLDKRYARDFEAPYPSASQRLGETGVVLVHVVIGADGRVVRASIARSSGFARLDDAALRQALAKWRFVPAMKDGVAVEGERDVPVTFRLLEG